MATNERTPLLANGHDRDVNGNVANANANADANGQSNDDGSLPGQSKPVTAASRWQFSRSNRILLAGFLVSFTLGITQIPIVYVFRLMECDIFYARDTHSSPASSPSLFTSLLAGSADARCLRPEIDAGTARQFSILGMSTSLSGVFNLFVCGYFIKLWGSRLSFVSQTLLLGLRVSTQIIGVTVGGRNGELIFQICQAIGIIGGPRGYHLVLNTSVSEVVAPKDRTAVFGRLQGSTMLGTAFGYLLGGVLADVYGIRRPFEIAFFLFVVSTFYGLFVMPASAASSAETSDQKQAARGLDAFFAPLKVIVPHRYRLESGQVIKNYGLIFLALGIFLGVFASGYAPLLLQMYATSAFRFKTTENGYLMFGNSLIRGLFLLFVFPKIIEVGRIRFNENLPPSQQAIDPPPPGREDSHAPTDTGALSVEPAGREAPKGQGQRPDSDSDPDEDEDAGTGFDLLFVRWSLVTDATVTLFAGFSSAAWQVYLAGFLLPFASGSAPAAKGVMTELCPPPQRRDAISAITLVESAAMLATQGLFGLIFAAFSEMGKPNLTFFFNAGIAVIGFTVLFMARFPPANSKRIDDDDDDDDNGKDRSTELRR
ncbi:major facilitator superfamily transporter [Xylaria sp. CBS 124048]|nr:major facilitator superfamily transporter [Xylaria sp. CBS 124048]